MQRTLCTKKGLKGITDSPWKTFSLALEQAASKQLLELRWMAFCPHTLTPLDFFSNPWAFFVCAPYPGIGHSSVSLQDRKRTMYFVQLETEKC